MQDTETLDLKQVRDDAAKLRNRWTYDPADAGEEPVVGAARENWMESEEEWPDEDSGVFIGGMLAITVHQDGGLNGLDDASAREVAEVIARSGGTLLALADEVERLRAAYPDAHASGAELIAAERRRQVEAEGYTPGHDDDHDEGEIAIVAAKLAVFHTDATVDDPSDMLVTLDRWGLVAKHASDPVRALTIAGALIAGEIDRLQRAAATR